MREILVFSQPQVRKQISLVKGIWNISCQEKVKI
jgi:hypothetical protein